MLDKGINVYKILDSKIYLTDLDIDEWPQIHYDPEECIKPYNGTVMTLKTNFDKIF